MWKEQGFRIFFLVSLFGFDVFCLCVVRSVVYSVILGKGREGAFCFFFSFLLVAIHVFTIVPNIPSQK